jgi:hypothetical protein
MLLVLTQPMICNTQYDVTWPPTNQIIGYQRWQISSGDTTEEEKFDSACNAFVQ